MSAENVNAYTKFSCKKVIWSSMDFNSWPTGLHSMMRLPDRLDLWLRRAGDVICFDFSKVFSTISHNILVFKQGCYRVGGWTTRWVENWMDRWTQRVVANCSFSASMPVICRVPQGSVQEPRLFNNFISVLVDTGLNTICWQWRRLTKQWTVSTAD